MTIAEVAPLRRFPRRMDILDYRIPDGLSLSIGDIVSIPFRSKTQLAVVTEMKNESEFSSLKDLIEIKHAGYFSVAAIDGYKRLAHELAQSLSTILTFAYSKPRPEVGYQEIDKIDLKLKTDEIDRLNELNIALPEKAFVSLQDEAQMTVLSKILSQGKTHTLLLCPHIHNAKIIRSLIGGEHLYEVNSDQTAKQREEQISSWKTRGGIMIGTRIAALPCAFFANLIVVIRSGTKEHQQYDRNPRFDARDVVLIANSQLNTPVYFTDFAPRIVDYGLFEQRYTPFKTVKPTVIDLSSRDITRSHPILSDHLLDEIKTGQKVLLILNKKGFAQVLSCKDCEYIVSCTSCDQPMQMKSKKVLSCGICTKDMPTLVSCTQCSGVLSSKGIGIEQIFEQLSEQFPDRSISRINESAENPDTDADIVLATQYYLDSVMDSDKTTKFDLVSDIFADIGLSQGSLGATEEKMRHLSRLGGIAMRSNAKFLIQTWDPSLIKDLIDRNQNLIKRELETRKALSFPPFAIMYRLTSEHIKKLDAVEESLKNASYSYRKNGSLVDILCPLTKEENLLKLLKKLDDSIIITRNPHI